MNLTTKHKPGIALNMACMTDIVFLLLIFFMLSASLAQPRALPIHLPTSNTQATITPTLRITMTADRSIYIDGQPIARHQLKEALHLALKKKQGTSLLLEADQSIPLSDAVDLATIAKALHTTMAIAIQHEQKK